ncbi:MAG: radical SAM protein [Chloroflexia bacterium]|nr:radical SAM protein [Chloroflexia bacterium]
MRIYSSKGCPNRCGFCYNWAYHKSTWRGKSTDKLIEEIKYLVQNYKIKGVGFTDDLFTFDTERLVSFCDRLIEEKLNINWYCNARVGLDRPQLQKMKDAGCKCIYFGIESGSKNIHKLINKGISIEKIHKTFDLCKQLGISTVGSFIIGFPDETEEDIRDTVNLAMALKPTIYDFSIYKCYPGTHLYDYSVKNGLFKQPASMEDWIDISSWDKSAISFSKLSNNELEVLCDFFTFKTIMNSAVHDTNTIIGYINLRKVVEVFTEVSRIVLNIMKSRKVLKKYSLI